MLPYLSKRLAVLVPTVLGVATVVFLLTHAMPGDPVDIMLGEYAQAADREALSRRLGLDRPVSVQYLSFLSGLARGDLGRSIQGDQPVAELVALHAPATAELALAALLIAVAIALPLGLLSAWKAGGTVDRLSLAGSMLGVAVPNFWLGPMLVLLFSIQLGWLPVSGRGGAAHLVLPALTLGTAMAGLLVRMTRSSLLEVMGEDYVRTARAKGLGESMVMLRHVLANALTPLLSVLGLQLGGLLAGAVITETIFAWPGLGRLMVQAIYSRDYPVVQGCVLVIAVTYVLVNLLTDLAYVWANPRVNYGDDDD
jgi:peptide/nickel transport system permease protein